jgi:anti-sigma factor RsiW
MKEVNTPNCGQEGELIAFLYGELNDVEARTFQLHLHDCAVCHEELAAFKGVRESVVAWRNESLGGLMDPARSISPVAEVVHGKPSALAALREFFNLSPLWMKGAVAFASLLFFLFTGLAIVHLRETPTPIVAAPGSKAYSEEQLNAIVAERMQEELNRVKKPTEQSTVSPDLVKNGPGRTPPQRMVKRDNEFASNVPAQKLRRPLSKTEREQLAADLRLTFAKNDSEFDLLGDRINQ